MPYTVDPNERSPGAGTGKRAVSDQQLRDMNFDYDYPNGLDLRPGYEKHDKLRDRLLDRARESARVMRKRHPDWRRIDRNLKAYVYQPTDDRRSRRSRQNRSDLDRDDEKVNKVIMPVSYAMLETILTFMTTAFLQDPVFKYEGTGPEDIIGAELLTQVVSKHIRSNAVGLGFHTAWRDMFAYGIGAASPVWSREYGKKTVLREVGFLDRLRGLFAVTGQERTESEYQILFEGNSLDNIDPYRFLPDPNASAHEVQNMEYVGWIDRTNYMSLLREESGPGGELFNVQFLQDMLAESNILRSQMGREGDDTDERTHTNNPVDVIWMYVDLIPSDWGLGDSDRPEKWSFAVAADKIVIKAAPVGLTHGKFPVAVGAPDYDGYSVAPSSKMATVDELQEIIDFLYTSHIENVKRVLNDNLVVDPSLINIHDVNDNRPGKIIRMRKKAWGKGGIDEAIQQLKIQDVTQQNVQEALMLQNFAQQATGATDNVMGSMPQRTSRISASEIQGIRSSSLSRLERPARIISMQFMLPIARMFAEHTMQLMTQDQFIKLTGDTRQMLVEQYGVDARAGRVNVTPMDLIVDYDVTPHDATFPGKESGQLWIQLFQILGQNPELAQAFDVIRIFKHIARQLGAKSVDNFVRRRGQPPQVMPDDQVEEAVRRGDAVPLAAG